MHSYCPVFMFPVPAPTTEVFLQLPSAKVFLFLCIKHQIGGLLALLSHSLLHCLILTGGSQDFGPQKGLFNKNLTWTIFPFVLPSVNPGSQHLCLLPPFPVPPAIQRTASSTYLPLHRQVLSGRQLCLRRMSHCLEQGLHKSCQHLPTILFHTCCLCTYMLQYSP